MDQLNTPRRAWPLLPGLLLFAIALLFKWEKWPPGTLLLLLSGVLAWAGALVQARRGPRMTTVAGVALALSITYAVFRFLYWPWAVVPGAAALAVGVWWLVQWRTRPRAASPIPVGLLLAGTVALMTVPTPALYHHMFFETPGAQRFLRSGIGHWYRYSHFLYEDGQYAKSAAMIDSAMSEVTAYHARTGKDGEWLLEQLRSTRATIEARQWSAFTPLRSPYELMPQR